MVTPEIAITWIDALERIMESRSVVVLILIVIIAIPVAFIWRFGRYIPRALDLWTDWQIKLGQLLTEIEELKKK